MKARSKALKGRVEGKKRERRILRERAGEFSPEGLHDLPFSVFIALESVERERLQR